MLGPWTLPADMRLVSPVSSSIGRRRYECSTSTTGPDGVPHWGLPGGPSTPCS